MKRTLSILMCMVLLLCMVPFHVGSFANAASPSQLTDGTTYNISWDANTETKYLYLTVNETGFYNLCIKDLMQTATLWFNMCDMDYEDTSSELDDYNYNFYGEKSQHDLKNIQLVSGHLYEIELEYLSYNSILEDFVSEDAVITINFTKNDYAPISLSLGANNNVWDSAEEINWFEFETTTAGDYLFESNQETYTYFNIFEKDTGTFVSVESFFVTLKNRITLKANKKYIIFSEPNDTDGRFIKLRLSKTTTDVSTVEIVQDNIILADDGYIYSDSASLHDSIRENLGYRVSFSNNTKQTFSYDELLKTGIWVWDIEYNGEIHEFDGDYYFAIGNQPVTVQYMNTSSKSTIHITSYVEWLSDLRVTTDFEDMTIEYENEEEQTYFWRLKPEQTNMYAFYSYDWDEIYAHYTIFDKNNQVIPYKNEAWVLQKGQEYALRVTYTYKDSYGLDVVFHMEPDRDHVHSYGKYVYNNDATTKKDGTKTRTCTVCGNKQTVTATGTKLQSKNPFTDVKKSDFFYEPVLWAVNNGITSGTSKTTFGPNEPCTRGQIATFLWRAAGCPKPATSKNPFKDVKTSDYYYKAVLWAVGKGITSGTSQTTFSPNDPCTRGQIAAFLWRANGSIKPKTSKNPFTDVKKSDFYYKAVLWAVENGITSGTTKTTFGPSEPCTRGQIATFLYRAYN